MEEVEIGDTPNDNIKEIYLIEEENKYKCEIQTVKEYLNINIYSNNTLKFKGNMHISNIQYNLGIYDYDINDIFDEIYKLNNNKFNLIKDIQKYTFQIEFIILNKKRYLKIVLNNDINSDQDYMKTINELKAIIKEKDNKIQLLEEELNKCKYDNFYIEHKEPKYILNFHKDEIWCSTVLKDGRFVTGSKDKSIIIYNKKTFEPDLTIKEHNNAVTNVIQLSSGNLASCSKDNTINIYNINRNEYQVIQTIKEHTECVTKIIELKNKQLVSCSFDKSIIFYNNYNNKYKKDYSLSTYGENGPAIQTKDNEICYYEDKDNTICFYDFIKKNNIKKIDKISVGNYNADCLLMISKDLLLITGYNIISIVNVNSHNLIKTISVSNSDLIYAACMLNKDMILTADKNKRIIQWKIENNNLKLISIKENAHDNAINSLSKIGNDLILSCSDDMYAKIW